ncbi:protein odr-4 homolog [Galendromus occidentalis]|uniref:Protein odr-4 homolog n=1 Tax=Galendromus occidentalis TaxID=34638 RepID=A0AAJ7L4J9_9ACAR|nr:protein odr-4 homolog [Galendromus occidentalis]
MKVLAYDEAFAASLHKLPVLSDPKELKLGVVIGIPGPKQAVLVHVALTPPLEKPTDKLDQWVAQHAKQVSRMLPGGVDVLGVVALCSPDVFEKQKSLVKQALSSVHKTLAKTHQLQDYPQRVLLHIDPNSFKLSSRLIDSSNFSGNGFPQDAKQVKNCTNFTVLESFLPLHFLGHISDEVVGQSLQKQLASTLKFIEDAVSSGDVLIEGQEITPEATLSSFSSENEGELRVQFAVRQIKPQPCGAIPLTTCGATVSIRGGFQVRAIVQSKATSEEAINAIKQDAVRNLRSRCGMHCEDLLVIEDEQRDPSMTHELPKRIFLRRSHCPSTVPFCDFVFHGDDPNDSLQAFLEILGLEVKPEYIERNSEKAPRGDIQDARDAAQVEEMVEDIICEGAKQLQKDPSNIIKLGLACSVAVLAMLVAYILLVRH